MADTTLYANAVAVYDFENNLNDTKGNYNLSGSGATYSTSGMPQGSYWLGELVGSGFFSVTNSAFTITEDYALSFWTRCSLTAFGVGPYISCVDTGNSNGFHVFISDRILKTQNLDRGTTRTANFTGYNFNDNTRYHVVVSFDASENQITAWVSTSTFGDCINGTQLTQNYDADIGTDGVFTVNTFESYGYYDEVVFWQRTLSASEANAIFNARDGGTSWRETVPSGTTYNEGITCSASGGISGLGQRIMNSSLSFAAAGAMSDKGPMKMAPVVSLASSAVLTDKGTLRISPTITLSGLAALSDSARRTHNPTITLAGLSALAALIGRTTSPTLILTAAGQLVAVYESPEGGTVYNEAVTMGTVASLSDVLNRTTYPALTLPAGSTLAGTHTLKTYPTVAMSGSAALTDSIRRNTYPTLTMSAISALTALSQYISVPVITFSVSSALTAITGTTYLGEITLGTVATFVSSLGAGTINVSAALSALATVSGSSTGILVASTTLASAAALVGEGVVAAVLGEHDGVYLIVKLADNLVFMKKLD